MGFEAGDCLVGAPRTVSIYSPLAALGGILEGIL